MFIITLVRFILHVLSLTCVIPSGNLIPLFYLGALMGRVICPFFWYLGNNHPSNAWAIVGGGSLVVGATHNLVSAIIITLEFTGQMTIIMPLMMSTISAYYTSSYL